METSMKSTKYQRHHFGTLWKVNVLYHVYHIAGDLTPGKHRRHEVGQRMIASLWQIHQTIPHIIANLSSSTLCTELAKNVLRPSGNLEKLRAVMHVWKKLHGLQTLPHAQTQTDTQTQASFLSLLGSISPTGSGRQDGISDTAGDFSLLKLLSAKPNK